MAGADDLDSIGKDQHTHRSANEVVAVNECVGDQLFPDDTRNLRLALGIEPLIPLHCAGVGDNEAQRLLKHIGQLAGDVTAVDVALVFDLIADKSHRLDDEGRQ